MDLSQIKLDIDDQNGYHEQLNQSPDRSLSPLGSRSRSRSYDRRSNRRSYSRSRSPRNRNTNNTNNSSNSNTNLREREERRARTRNTSNNSSSTYKSIFTDKELGLKYRWEKTVFVSNIPYDVKWPEMKDLFRSKVGEIHFCEIFEKDGKSMGVGTIEFKLLEDALKAIEVMNQYDMGNRKLSVRIDKDGSRTRKAKEMSKDLKQLQLQLQQQQQQQQSFNIGGGGGGLFGQDNQAASLLASLNQANVLAALGLNNNGTATQSPLAAVASQTNSGLNTPNLMNIISSLSGTTQLGLLNQLAQQLKLEGPVTNRVFVASLDFKVDEYKIREVFNLAGKVQSVSLFKDRDGKSRGISVVEYSTPLEALNAVLMFHNQVLLSRQMTVRFDTKPPKEEDAGQNANKLPSGLKSIGLGLGLNFGKTSDVSSTANPLASSLDALNMLTGIGASNSNPVSNLSTLAGLAGLTGTSQNLGLSGLLGNLNTNMPKTNCTISKVFVKNIPFSWDERKLKEKFRQAGNIEFVEIKHRDGKSRGCGLIKFASPEQAQKAVELFNGSRFEGRTLEVKLDQLSS